MTEILSVTRALTSNEHSFTEITIVNLIRPELTVQCYQRHVNAEAERVVILVKKSEVATLKMDRATL